MSTVFENGTPQRPDDFDDEVTGSVGRPELRPASHAPEARVAPTAEHEWYVAVGGAQFGPFSTAELRSRLAAGVFPEDATVWRDGRSEWEEWGWIPELKLQAARQPAPPKAPEGPATLSPVEQPATVQPRPGLRGISPWYAMIAAVLLGLGVSFVVLRVVAGQSSEPAVVATPSEPHPLGVQLSVKGALGPDLVQAALADRPPQVALECWAKARESQQPNPPATVSLQVRVDVDATGYVTGAQSLGDPPGYPGLGTCIAGRTRGWRFPTGSGGSTVTLSLVFRRD